MMNKTNISSLEDHYLNISSTKEAMSSMSYPDFIGSNAGLLNYMLEGVKNNLLQYQDNDFKDYYKRKVLTGFIISGEINSLSVISPNNLGYLILVDLAIGGISTEAAKISSLVIANGSTRFDSTSMISGLMISHLLSITNYAITGTYNSEINKYDDDNLFREYPSAFQSAGRITYYFLKFIVAHELSHISEGHLNVKEHITKNNVKIDNVLLHKNEYDADIKAMDLILKSFPDKSMIGWDMYEEALIAPFILFGICAKIESITGESHTNSTHPSYISRLNNLIDYIEPKVSNLSAIKRNCDLVLSLYGLSLETLKA